jgi:hypothetical protein
VDKLKDSYLSTRPAYDDPFERLRRQRDQQLSAGNMFGPQAANGSSSQGGGGMLMGPGGYGGGVGGGGGGGGAVAALPAPGGWLWVFGWVGWRCSGRMDKAEALGRAVRVQDRPERNSLRRVSSQRGVHATPQAQTGKRLSMSLSMSL